MNEKTPLTLKSISLNDKPLFDRYLSMYPPSTSELTFTNIFCWAEVAEYRFCEYKDHLIITKGSETHMCAYPPIGPEPEQMMTNGIPEITIESFIRIDKELAFKIHTFSDLHCDPENSDYIYRLKNLRELRGKKYDGKRNFIRRLEALQPTVQTLTAEHAHACMMIEDEWLLSQKHNPDAQNERIALKCALDHFDALQLHGIGIFVDGSLVGFAIGEQLNASTYVEHFEKALTKYTGIYPFTLYQFVLSISEQFIYLNRQQDLGITGLQKSKLSWHPEPFRVDKFTLKML